MDRNKGSSAGKDAPREAGAPDDGAPGMRKEREAKEDGRYIIFYTFDGDEEGNEE